jgi:hypothetical protein
VHHKGLRMPEVRFCLRLLFLIEQKVLSWVDRKHQTNSVAIFLTQSDAVQSFRSCGATEATFIVIWSRSAFTNIWGSLDLSEHLMSSDTFKNRHDQVVVQ